MRNGIRTEILIVALFAALAAAFFWRVFVGELLLPTEFLRYFQPWEAHVEPAPSQPQWNPLAADGILQFYPWRVFAAEQIRDGRIPLWNPYQFCGAPFLADGQSAVLYPPNLLFLLLDPASAFGYSAILHVFLMQLFTYMWLRRLGLSRTAGAFGAVSFAFCGFCVVWMHLPTLVASLTWLPAALAGHEWRRATGKPMALALTALALGMSILAGHPQMAYYVLITYALYVALRAVLPWRGSGVWREVGWGAAPLLIGVGLAMAQLLPTLELSRLSQRAAAAPQLAAYMRMALKPEWLVGLLIPDFYGNPRLNNYWGGGNYVESAGYVSAVVWVFALYAGLSLLRRRTAGLGEVGSAAQTVGILAVAAVLTAFGPLAYLGFYVVPGFADLPAVGRLLGVFGLAMAALGACGLEMLLRLEGSQWRRSPKGLVASGVLVLTLVGVAVVVAAVGIPIESKGNFLYNLGRFTGSQIAEFALILALAVGLGIGAACGVIGRPMFRGMICFLAIGNVFWLGMGDSYWAVREEVFPETPEITTTRLVAGDARLLPLTANWTLRERPTAVMPPNTAMLWHLRDVNGYDSLYWLPYKRFADRVEGQDASPRANGNMILIRNYRSPLLADMNVGAILSPVALDCRNLKAVASSKDLILYQVLDVQSRADFVGGRGKAEIRDRGPNQVYIKCLNRRGGRLIVRDCDYPGWRCWVNHQRRPYHRWNGVFRCIDLEAGANEVWFRFEPDSFRGGLFVSLVAVAVVAALAAHDLVHRDSAATNRRREDV